MERSEARDASAVDTTVARDATADARREASLETAASRAAISVDSPEAREASADVARSISSDRSLATISTSAVIEETAALNWETTTTSSCAVPSATLWI